jgi:hypothetical protein
LKQCKMNWGNVPSQELLYEVCVCKSVLVALNSFDRFVTPITNGFGITPQNSIT